MNIFQGTPRARNSQQAEEGDNLHEPGDVQPPVDENANPCSDQEDSSRDFTNSSMGSSFVKR